MNGIKIEFQESRKPIYWENFINYLQQKYKDDYDSYILNMNCELLKYGAMINPLFAYNERSETLYFKDKDNFDKFVTTWGEYDNN